MKTAIVVLVTVSGECHSGTGTEKLCFSPVDTMISGRTDMRNKDNRKSEAERENGFTKGDFKTRHPGIAPINATNAHSAQRLIAGNNARFGVQSYPADARLR